MATHSPADGPLLEARVAEPAAAGVGDRVWVRDPAHPLFGQLFLVDHRPLTQRAEQPFLLVTRPNRPDTRFKLPLWALDEPDPLRVKLTRQAIEDLLNLVRTLGLNEPLDAKVATPESSHAASTSSGLLSPSNGPATADRSGSRAGVSRGDR